MGMTRAQIKESYEDELRSDKYFSSYFPTFKSYVVSINELGLAHEDIDEEGSPSPRSCLDGVPVADVAVIAGCCLL